MEFKYYRTTLSDRLYSDSQGSLKTWSKALLIALGLSATTKLMIGIPKLLKKRLGQRDYDLLLTNRNRKIARVQDKYNRGGLVSKNPMEAKKYYKFLHSIYEDTLKLNNLKGSKPDQTVYDEYIVPLIAIVSILTISDVYLFAGESLIVDRNSLELVYAPGSNGDIKSVSKDPFRNIIYKGKWPSHDFKVTTVGDELNQIVSDLFKFLSQNPQYLAIRL